MSAITDPPHGPAVTLDRDLHVRRALRHLDELKARPSQHSASWIRNVVADARDLLHALHVDLDGHERAPSAGESVHRPTLQVIADVIYEAYQQDDAEDPEFRAARSVMALYENGETP